MRGLFRSFYMICLILCVGMFSLSSVTIAQPKEKEVLQAMKKTADFMMNTVSMNGGFVWQYLADLSDQWGETPARRSMIWVQDPGTVGVGYMFLRAYKVTGDTEFLEYAKRAADALIWGQHPEGGWHYFIDFDMAGVQKFYDEVLSKCWGYEEYLHYYGNCTYDDNVTTGVARYLLEIYMTTLDPAYREPLLKVIDFILKSQYPNGGWPQRYPINKEFSHHGLPDYTHYYTFNDNVIQGNVYFLLEAWKKLGNEEYKKAAYRGMDFVLISQLAPPQAGWGQQYNMEMQSVQSRSYEPASVMPGQTVTCARDLMKFYKITGDRRYLKGIPDAIEWLENSYLQDDHKVNNRVTHATFYELGTNKPLYAHREGTNVENGHYWIDYEPKNFPGHYGMQTSVNVQAIKKEYERVNALTPKEAMAEWYPKAPSKPSAPLKVDSKKVRNIIDTRDERGAWVHEITIPFYKDIVNNPPERKQGIHTRTFIRNMQTMISYINYLKYTKK